MMVSHKTSALLLLVIALGIGCSNNQTFSDNTQQVRHKAPPVKQDSDANARPQGDAEAQAVEEGHMPSPHSDGEATVDTLPPEPYRVDAVAATYDAAKMVDLEFTLKASQVGGSLPVEFKIMDQPKYGEIRSFDRISGKVVYRARSNVFSSDFLTFVAISSQAESAKGLVSFNISNRKPTLANLKLATAINTTLTVQLQGADLDGDSLVYAVGPLPEGLDQAPVLDERKGTMVIRPALNYVGTIVLPISCRDEQLQSDPASLTIEIQESPEGDDFEISTPMNVPVEVNLATNKGDASFIYELEGEKNDKGELVLANGVALLADAFGKLKFVPKNNTLGQSRLIYKVSNKVASAAGSVKITVRNNPPVTSPMSREMIRNQKEPMPFNLKGASFDPDGNPLSFRIVTAPKFGELKWSEDKSTVSYLPKRHYQGPDSFQYVANDGAADSNTSLVSIDIKNPISATKPALAVRGLACIVCHAQVRANIVTDFGYGDSFYLGETYDDFTGGRRSWYNNNQNSWQAMRKFEGQLFIPNAPIRKGMTLREQPLTGKSDPELVAILKALQAGIEPAPPAATAPLKTLEGLLNFTYNNAADTFNAAWVPAAQLNKPVVSIIKAPASLPALVTSPAITIRAPSSAEILAAAPELPAGVVDFRAVPLPDATTLPPTPGFVVVRNSVGAFVTNPSSAPVTCYGDVVINGPLLLKQATIDTDKYGCRLYVTGTVFIEGNLLYKNSANNSNLQISSSRAIILGIGSTPNVAYSKARGITDSSISPLEDRFAERGAVLRGGLTMRDHIRPLVLADAAIVTENNRTPLLDSQDDGSRAYDPNSFTGTSPSKHASILYKALLFNAPVVQSRYLGEFSGTVIAEAALFSVGHFEFVYDPAFDQSSTLVLPLLDTIFFVQ